MKVLIIEDEKLTARDLVATINAIDNSIEVLPFLHSLDEALYYFSKPHSIDLIFSDIDLGDGLSFDIYQKVTVNAPIIFCTAFHQYMLDAFKTNGIDYILKPFRQADIEAALAKYRTLQQQFSTSSNLQSNAAKLPQLELAYNRSLLVQRGDKFLPVQVNDVAYFTIENEAVFAYTFSQNKHYIVESLDSLESTCGNLFYRVNRQFLVNKNAIKSASRHFNRKLLVHLTVPCKENILVGKLKVTSFLNWLQSI